MKMPRPFASRHTALTRAIGANNNWLLFILFALIATLALLATPHALRYSSRVPLVREQGGWGIWMTRLLVDNREVEWYRAEGAWFREGYKPYIDRPYEYPVLATALFTIPALFTPDPLWYHLLYRLGTIVAGFWLIWATWRFCRSQGRPHDTWLLLLPSVCYTIVNRFDVFPALLLQLSLLALWERRFIPAWVLLAVSFLFKWYAGLLLPLYLLAMFETARAPYERIRAFQGLIACVGLIVLGHVWLFAWGGTLLDAMNPYAIHFVRPPEMGSMPAAFLALSASDYRVINPDTLSLHDPIVGAAASMSTILQLAGLAAAVMILARPRAARMLTVPHLFAHAAFLVVGCFVLFSRVYSQQWILWLVPLFAFTRPSRSCIIAFIAFDLINYAVFPILFGVPPGSAWYYLFLWLVIARSCFLGGLLMTTWRILRDNDIVSPALSTSKIQTSPSSYTLFH